MPTLDEITAMLTGSTVFSVLDAESGFHQLPLSAESRDLTTFSSHCGLFRFKILPFGIACAPEIFQRVVSPILMGLEGVPFTLMTHLFSERTETNMTPD